MIVTQLGTKSFRNLHDRQPNTSLLDLEAWSAAHEELSKQTRLELQHVASCINYQFGDHEEEQLLNLITPGDLKFDQSAENMTSCSCMGGHQSLQTL